MLKTAAGSGVSDPDRSGGQSGVDLEQEPSPLTYEGEKGILPHVTFTRIGDEWEEGEGLVILFRDHVVHTTVDEVEPVDWEDENAD